VLCSVQAVYQAVNYICTHRPRFQVRAYLSVVTVGEGLLADNKTGVLTGGTRVNPGFQRFGFENHYRAGSFSDLGLGLVVRMVKSSPGVHPKPRFGPILDSTASVSAEETSANVASSPTSPVSPTNYALPL